MYGFFSFSMCVGGVIIGVIGAWGGGLLCVVDVLAGGQGGGGSEDRTSLRGVAVNP